MWTLNYWTVAVVSPVIGLSSALSFTAGFPLPSMLYRCSSGSKSPRLQPKTFSLLPKIQRECLSCLWFCQYFPQRKNKLQRFCNLFCSVRINACSVGLVTGLRMPHSQHLGGPIANNCLVFEVMLVSCKLPGWPLDAAYKGLFYQSDHTGTRPKCSFDCKDATVWMPSIAHAMLCMLYSIWNPALGAPSDFSIWSQALWKATATPDLASRLLHDVLPFAMDGWPLSCSRLQPYLPAPLLQQKQRHSEKISSQSVLRDGAQW